MVRNAAVELAVGVAIESPTGRIRRVFIDAGHGECLAVVERRVAAAMVHRDRVVLRHLIEIVNADQAIVLHLGVVEEVPFHPCARWRLAGLGAELVHDARDGDELDNVGVADDYVVEQHVAGCVIVAVDEPGHDGHLPGVQRLRRFDRLDVCAAADGGEAAGLDRERFGLRQALRCRAAACR